MLSQHDRPLTIVPEIPTVDGTVVTSQEAILEGFTCYYTTLYSSSLPPDFNLSSLAPPLDSLALEWLYDSEHFLLVTDFTPEEITLAISSLPNCIF